MTATGLELISQALRLLGVLGEGQTASDGQGADGLVVLNQMVDLWGIDGQVSILSFARTTKALSASTQRYTIGPSADIAMTPRPSWIEEARVIPDTSLADAQETEQPVFLHTVQTWAAKVLKNLTGTYPTELYYDHSFDNATERGNIDVWPITTASNVTLVLYTPTILGQFATLATSYKFAPGYPQAIVPNLALLLAPYYGKPESELGLVMREAVRAKGLVETQNLTVPLMRGDRALAGRGGFDMRSGR